MLPQLSSGKCLNPSPNGVISPIYQLQTPDFLSFRLRMQRLPSYKTMSNHQSFPSWHIWSENQKGFADVCPCMDSRYRYSVASWHRWNKSSAAKFNNMSSVRPPVAIQPSSNGHRSAAYMSHRNISKVAVDWTPAS